MDDRELVDRLCEIERGLTESEIDFVEEAASRVIDQRRALTKAQRSQAEQILEEKGQHEGD